MKIKLSLILILILSLMCSFIPLQGAEKNEDELLKESMKIGEEIDRLVEEIHKLPTFVPSKKEKRESKESLTLTTKVITPSEITQTLIPEERKKRKMSLDFEKANLEDVLQTIGRAAGINIVLDPILKGKKVDLHLENVPIEEALSLLYNAYGLGSYKIGRSLFVSSKDKIKRETLITKMVRLKNLNVEEARNLIKDLVEVINVSKETNTLVVIGSPEEIKRVDGILEEADKPQLQVIIEAKIIEVNKDALQELGIDWSDYITTSFQESRRNASLSDLETPVGSPFRIYKLARSAIQFETILKMLESKNKAKVLSNPRIATLNNKEAEIFVGDRVPYQVTIVSGGTTTTEVRFVEPGIRLKITPSIIEKDFVVIKIEPEVSYIYGWRGPQDQYPWIKARKAVAYVRVRNGEPFVLGGILSKEDKKNLYKVPFIGDLPLIGNIFKYQKKSYYDSELIITVAPTVVNAK